MPDDPARPPTCTLSQQDWSLHRKADRSAERHRQKLKQAVKDQLNDIMHEGDLITSPDGKRMVKVPLRGLALPRFQHKDGGEGPSGTGSGAGKSKVGDVLGQAPQGGAGKGPRAGNEPGEDVYEVMVSLDDLADMLFEHMRLPRLVPKALAAERVDRIAWTDRRRTGALANLDRRRMLKENILRNALAGASRVGDFRREDMRFRSYRERPAPRSRAVVVAMRDVSGSMGEFQQWVSRTSYFWIVRFLRTCYQEVSFVFITHHAEAQEVGEDAFFSLGESGGTRVAPAYALCRKILAERYPEVDWNAYALHYSDGDTWGEDDRTQSLAEIRSLLPRLNLFGYAEIREHTAWSGEGPSGTLRATYAQLQDPHFVVSVVESKEGVAQTLRDFFGETGVAP